MTFSSYMNTVERK